MPCVLPHDPRVSRGTDVKIPQSQSGYINGELSARHDATEDAGADMRGDYATLAANAMHSSMRLGDAGAEVCTHRETVVRGVA
jgi:hypothetical protein